MRSTAGCRILNCKGMPCGEKPTASRRRRTRRQGGSFIYTQLSCTGLALMRPKAADFLSLQIDNSTFTHLRLSTNAIPNAQRLLPEIAEQRLLHYQRAARNVARTQLRFFHNRQFPHSRGKLRRAE